MKVRTITCHNVYNYGASLQELALVKFLNLNGYKAKSISYQPTYLSKHHKLFICENTRWNKNPVLKAFYISIKLPSRIRQLKRKKRFDAFEKAYIPTTKTRYSNNNELTSIAEDADIYICGSDQIWNPLFPNGKDPAFYLDFVKNKNVLKVSYAASLATDHIPTDHIPFLKKHLEPLDLISVRETSAQKLLYKLGFKNTHQVLDPVFLLEREYWKDVADESQVSLKKKYILVYDFDSNPNIKQIAKTIAKDHNLLIVGLNQSLKYVDKNYSLYGPAEFLKLINNAEVILTNSFHAVAFSIIFNKRFVVFKRNENINTRMQDLLELFDLSELLIDPSKPLDISNLKYNYGNVNQLMKQHINKSRKFLLNSISNHKNQA